MGVVARIGRGVRAAWRAAIHWPVELARWIRVNPSRAVALVWLAGMAMFVVIDGRRAYQKYRREAAVRVADDDRPDASDQAPEVVEMLDVDAIEQIQTDRMHANGLGAGGENDVDQATIDAARASRGRVAAIEGERAGGAGEVVVMTKGGIAGWLARNKDKKADPDTLKWLREEEAIDGRAAYASWAEGDSTIAAWLERGRKRGEKPVTGDRQQVTGNEGADAGSAFAAGSGSGSGSGSAEPKKKLEKLDLEAMGIAAVVAITPRPAVPMLPEPSAAEIGDLKARLPSDARIEVSVRAHHVVIAVPNGALFAGEATVLSEPGKHVIRQLAGLLGGVAHRDFQVVAASGARAMEVAGTLAIAGLPVERMSMAVATDADKSGVDIVLIVGAR